MTNTMHRGVHLDLKGCPPTPSRLLELTELFAALDFNLVLVEWEDTFPWTVDERFRSPTAYSKTEVQEFCSKAEELGLELVPLVQCLGHMENPLSVEGYAHLREVEDMESGLDPVLSESRDLILAMVDDVLSLMPGVRRFHLGGDEARTLGKGMRSQPFMEKHGKGKLYLNHVEPLLDHLNARGVRPLLWHDMMIDWDKSDLEKLATRSDLMPWSYGGDPASDGDHCHEGMIKRFKKAGFSLWGAGAYKGAEGYDAESPDLSLHIENAVGWMKLADQYEFKGVVATAWSRYAVDTIQCNPIDSSLDSLLLVAEVFRTGHAPEGKSEEVMKRLEALGTGKRFLACRDVMDTLARLKKEGWEKVQHARQVLVLARRDPKRTSSRNPKLGLHAMVRLGEVVEEGDVLVEKAKKAFEGLMDIIWIEEYFETRVEPLKTEYREIVGQYRSLMDIKGENL